MNKQQNNNEMDFPPMKKNGYAIIFDKWIEGDNQKFADKVYPIVNTNNFHHFLDSVNYQTYREMYVDSIEAIKEDYLDGKGKGKKKISQKAFQSIKSMAIHFTLRMLDDLDKDDERSWEIEHIIESYFDNDKINFSLGLGFGLMQENIENQEIFVPKMNLDKAHKKNLKTMETDEWNNIIVPADVKFAIGKVKAHLDLYMWDEFIKAEYNTLKLMGFNDEQIIEELDSENTIIAFCYWCKGYTEGVNEHETELNK
jgi:hypothetical protein